MSSSLQAALIPFFAYAWYFLLVKPIHLLVMVCLKWKTPSNQCIYNSFENPSASPATHNAGRNSKLTYQAQGNGVLFREQKQKKTMLVKMLKSAFSWLSPKGGK